MGPDIAQNWYYQVFKVAGSIFQVHDKIHHVMRYIVRVMRQYSLEIKTCFGPKEHFAESVRAAPSAGPWLLHAVLFTQYTQSLGFTDSQFYSYGRESEIICAFIILIGLLQGPFQNRSFFSLTSYHYQVYVTMRLIGQQNYFV